MPSVEVLLQEVYDHPEDDARRLVLADAFEERGDPRGLFIHVQMLAHRGLATRRSRGQESALRHAHGALLHGPLAPAVLPKETKFARGFAAEVMARDLTRLPAELAAWNTVERLTLSEELSPLLERAELKSLTTLSSRWGPILARRRPLPSLTVLQAPWEPPDDLEAALSWFPGLQRFGTWGGGGAAGTWRVLQRVPARIGCCHFPVQAGELVALAKRWAADRARTLVLAPMPEQSERPLGPMGIRLSGDELELFEVPPRESSGTLASARLWELRAFADAHHLKLAVKGEAAFVTLIRAVLG